MKPNTTYIDKDELLKVAREAGCKVEDQRGFHKVTKENAKAIFYVALTKSCGRVDISQVMVDKELSHAMRDQATAETAIIDLGGESFGKVHQQVHFGRSKEDILGTFRFLCEHATELQPLPAKERQRPVALKGTKKDTTAAATGVKVDVNKSTSEQIEELVAKRQRLTEAAGRMNMPVNPTILEKIDAQIEALKAKGSEPAPATEPTPEATPAEEQPQPQQ